jgi:preprotein translocase subunit SecE
MATDKTAAVKAPAKKDSKPKKESKFHPIRFIKEMWGELKKLTWLSKKDLMSHTAAVIVFVLGWALIIGVLDLIFSGAFSALSKLHIG